MVISKAAIRRPVTVVMAFIGVAMIGAFSAFRLPIEQFPQIEIPYVGVSIPYSGTSAQEIERNVTRPVEEILSTMTGVDRMFSFTRPGQVFFNLSLHPDADVNGKGIEAKDLVEGAPGPVKQDATKEEADEIKAKLEEAGASVEIK